jgi:hypothetical protein
MNKSSLNKANDRETERDLRKVQDRVERVFPKGKVFDYAICFLHLIVCLRRIHAKNLPSKVRDIMPAWKQPTRHWQFPSFFIILAVEKRSSRF